MTENLALRAGHDIDYHTRRSGGGHAGGMAYYTGAAAEPPGKWAGKGAAKLGLAGDIDAGVIKRLFHEDIGPDGERLAAQKRGNYEHTDVAAAVEAYKADHPYASETELAEVRSNARSQNRNARPYFDFALGAVKSVSLLLVSLVVAAKLARDEGDTETAASLEAEAAAIEQAQFETAEVLVREIEASAAYTRTGGHHGRNPLGYGTTGEWRDTDGVASGIFVQHTSQEGDPHLHAHVTVWNRVRRADRANDKYTTLDSRSLYAQRLRLAAIADRDMETRMTALGWPMLTREDGNGAEVAGVERHVIDRFSSRRVKMLPEIEKLAAQYRETHGHEPNARALWLMKQHVSMKQRAASGKRDDWEKEVTADEIRVLAGVHVAVRAVKARAIAVLDDAAKAKAARIAVAEVQKRHAVWSMAQLMFEVHRALPVMPAGTDSKALIAEVAHLAVSGRAGTEVVQATAGDITDVSGLGVRISDGGSIYRPPNEERWTTLEHLDTEEFILKAAKRTVLQLVTEVEARKLVADTDLNAEQAEAVVLMLTSASAATALVAPAGSGKSHTMAVFARLWTAKTQRRVIGLTTSTNAAHVLQNEGLAESYNIAEFLGKNIGTDALRRPVPLNENDVLVLDEATQVGTRDFALVQEAAKLAGARLAAVGDTQQLGSPEAGGMFRLLTQEVPVAELHEVRRFNVQWEAEASLLLREGNFAAISAYDRRGRIWGADRERAFDRAASLWLADHLEGKKVLLLAGSNPEATELSRRVQAKLIESGEISEPVVNLPDGNLAGVGDLIRARLNTTIDAGGGQKLTNRDTLRITGLTGRDALVRRLRLDGIWTPVFKVPRVYLGKNAELDYAGNTHVAEGRTVDRGRLLVTETLSRSAAYVGMTRGREENTAIVVTGDSAPEGKKPFEQATPESVLRAILQRDTADLSATEQIRISQEWSGGTGHVLNLWSAVTRKTLYPKAEQLIKAALTHAEQWRYDREHSRPVLLALLREHQLAGQDIEALVQEITAASVDGARSISGVLHGRLEQIKLPEASEVSWAQRTPDEAPAVAHELAAGLDDRRAALAERATADPEPWLTDHLGAVPAAGGLLREDYARRAGVAAAYREAAGITDPAQAVNTEPHRDSPELEALRQATFRALEITDERALLRAASRGELEARVLDGDRAQAVAPPEVGGHLRLTAQAEADARVQAADAAARQAGAEAEGARQLAETLAAEKTRLAGLNEVYEAWSTRTAPAREMAGQAKAELERRGPENTEPQTLTAWWAGFEADAEGLERAIEREHEAAAEAGRPWPLVRAEVEGPHPEAAEVLSGLRRDGYLPEAEHEAKAQLEEAPAEPEISSPDAAAGERIGQITEQITEAKHRLAAETEHTQASSEYQARVSAEAEPEPQNEREPA